MATQTKRVLSLWIKIASSECHFTSSVLTFDNSASYTCL